MTCSTFLVNSTKFPTLFVQAVGGHVTLRLPYGSHVHAGYRGVSKSDVIVDQRRLLGKPVHYFSSSHERSHLLCAFGMSSLPKGTPCYALIWEGEIGAFYEIDSELNITLLADVLNEPGNRYALLYGLADPTFPKDAPSLASRTQGNSWPWPHFRIAAHLQLKRKN